MTTHNRFDKRNKPKGFWLKGTLVVLFIIILGVGIIAFSIYDNAKETVNEHMHKKVTAIDERLGKQKISVKESLNILLLGVDKRGNNRGRSDALIILTLDPAGERMQVVSIPRDTRTTIVGKGFEDKINHAYAFGGADMSISTVESLLDIKLDYYVEINMEGLADLVDSIGGITVNNELDWIDTGYYQKGYHYAEGNLTLNGPQTMGFVRMRYQDPKGDFGRTNRQRKVIEAIIDKGAGIGSVGKINGVIDVLGDNMATNMDFSDMKDLFLNYNSVRKNVKSYMLKGSGTTIDGIYYYVVPKEEVIKVREMITGLDS